MKYFLAPGILLILAVATAFFVSGPTTALVVATLAMMEVSLSFDNAVVNAAVLEHWPSVWRKVFLTLGLVVAVFGMRLILPIVVVSVASGIGARDVVLMALHSPHEYALRLTAVHPIVAAFGGAFLMMVGLGFFLDAEKDNHWIGPIEHFLTKVGQVEAIQAALTLVAITVTGYYLKDGQAQFDAAGVLGVVTFVGTKAIGTMLGGGGKIVQAGIGGFLYLELLDASFSFDGVIGAFALSDQLFVIAAGLGVGALAVRELTLMAVDRGTLVEYPYLEHGAFWSITTLAGMMMASAVVEIPQLVMGLIGSGLIAAAFFTSIIKKRHETSF